jgi:hypothetical protein
MLRSRDDALRRCALVALGCLQVLAACGPRQVQRDERAADERAWLATPPPA